MRTRIILGIAIGCLFSQALLGKRESISASLSVRQQFDSEISNLIKNLKSVPSSDQKWRTLAKSEHDLESLRKKSSRQVEPDEIYMDTIATALKSIPRGSKFKKEECSDYRTRIQFQFDPKDEEKNSPPVAESLAVLDVLCK